MKKFLSAILLVFASMSMYSQTYNSGILPFQTHSQHNQEFEFVFNNVPSSFYGQAKLTVYFEGDFGDMTEYISVYDSLNNYGNAGDHIYDDCAPLDSNVFFISSSNLSSIMYNNTVKFYGEFSGDVDMYVCSFINRISMRLEVDYCQFGIPVNMAQFTDSHMSICNSGSLISLNAIPAGGTFSGFGVSGSNLDPNLLEADSSYNVFYTFTDNIGCTTKDVLNVNTLSVPAINDTAICKGAMLPLSFNYGSVSLYSDAMLTNLLGSGSSILTPAYNSTTDNYLVQSLFNSTFKITNIDPVNYQSVDINNYAGDDRGGIAVTPDYVFVTGDYQTVRYNSDDLTNPASFSIHDALVSDLKGGKIYSLYDTVSLLMPDYNNYYYLTINSIVELDSNLQIVGNPIALSTSFTPNDYVGIFSGYGEFAIHDTYESRDLYVYNFAGELVNKLYAPNVNIYGAENWAIWGALESDNNGYSLVYNEYINGANGIIRYDVSNGNKTILLDGNDYYISDMASFVVSPWNNKLYYHYESSADLGSGSEILGFIDLTLNIDTTIISTNSCPAKFTVQVDEINLGNDIVACDKDPFVTLFAGNGFQSYTWNGVNNNYNAFAVSQDGTYIVEVLNSLGCVLIDTINVVFTSACLSVEEAELTAISVYPNPATDFVNIQMDAQNASTWMVKIVDMNGRIIRNSKVEGYNFTLNISELTTGIYTLQFVSNNGEMQNVKVVKK